MIRKYFSYYISAGTSSLWRTSVQPLSSFLFASVLPSDALTLPSVEAPTFACFLTFLYRDLSLSYFFHTSLSATFHLSLSSLSFINSCAFSYYLSFLLPDEACGRKVVNSTVCCSSVCFVTFVFFTLRCQLFFILRCHLFSLFKNSCAFTYYLSFLLPDEACLRNIVNYNVS